MQVVEITNFLDQRISELAKNRLPEEPAYPSGNTQYASFMMPRDEMGAHDKDNDKWASHTSQRPSSTYRSNGNWSDDGKATSDKNVNGKDRYIMIHIWNNSEIIGTKLSNGKLPKNRMRYLGMC